MNRAALELSYSSGYFGQLRVFITYTTWYVLYNRVRHFSANRITEIDKTSSPLGLLRCRHSRQRRACWRVSLPGLAYWDCLELSRVVANDFHASLCGRPSLGHHVQCGLLCWHFRVATQPAKTPTKFHGWPYMRRLEFSRELSRRTCILCVWSEVASFVLNLAGGADHC